MADEEVRYKLTLEDLLSGKLNSADAVAKQLESSMARVVERVAEYAAVYASVDFFKDAYSDYEKLHQSELQLGNTLQNVGERAGITKDELLEMAEAGRSATEFTKQQYVEAETSLLRYSRLNKTTFQETLGYAADIATARHMSVNDVAAMLGRAIDMPEKAGRALMQYGIVLSVEQQKWLKAQQDSGHLAEAQKFVFEQLESHGFKGAAALAAMNDPMHDIDVAMESLKENLGEGIANLIKEISPYLKELIEDFQKLVTWIRENSTMLKDLAEAVGVAWLAFKTATTFIVPFVEGLQTITAVAPEVEEGLEGVGVAADAALGPIGLMAIAIGGLVLLYNELTDAADESAKATAKAFADDDSMKMSSVAKAAYDANKKKGLSDTAAYEATVKDEQGKLDADKSKTDAELADAKAKLAILVAAKGGESAAYLGNAGNPLDDVKVLADKVAELEGKETKIGNYSKGLADFKKQHESGVSKLGKIDGPAAGTETKKAGGPKVVNINVTIGNLIDKFTISTTNVMESTTAIKQKVAMALTSAVNDAEILAGEEH